MDIPKSLESTWKQVSQDGKITKADYEKLVTAAAPTGKEEELDETETNFLVSLKSDLEKNGGDKGIIPVSSISFKESSGSAQPKISIKDFGEVPATLKE